MYLLTRLSSLNLLQRNFHIRLATGDDISEIAIIIRKHEKQLSGSLGAPHYPSLRKAATECRLYVAEIDVGIVGFVEFYRRQDGGQTIYSLAVDAHYEGLGIGRNLLYSVECPIRLKCPAYVNGNMINPANTFYKRARLKLANANEKFNVWELPILPILVQGRSNKIPEIARQSGWAYGIRSSERPIDWAYQVDIDWTDYSWSEYLHNISIWKPFAALVPDYENANQKRTMLNRIEHLKQLGVQRILVCPKFKNAVKDIPNECVVAVSIPSKYAGYVPQLSELYGRKVHLLGGSPPKWFGSKKGKHNLTGYIAIFQGANIKIISVDGNSHTGAAVHGGIWINGVWNFNRSPLEIYKFMVESGNNIREDLHRSSKIQQLSLF